MCEAAATQTGFTSGDQKGKMSHSDVKSSLPISSFLTPPCKNILGQRQQGDFRKGLEDVALIVACHCYPTKGEHRGQQ